MRFRSAIDAPHRGRSSSTHFVLRGWCYSPDAPIVSIRARIAERLFPGVHGDARPDVVAAYRHETGSGASGFEIPVCVQSSRSRGQLEVALRDGNWHVARAFLIRTPCPPRLSPAEWDAFWSSAWLGRAAAWDALIEPERDFVVARSRVRGWFNLVSAPHHAPRPRRGEAFPADPTPAADLPRLVAVTPSFQQGGFLEQTVRSVLEQQGVRIEYVVQDGGSTDGSTDIIRRYAPRLATWESVPDSGQAAAIARGFSHVVPGPDDVMMFLNSDDLLMPGAARFVAAYFARHPEVDVVYGHRVLIDDAGMEIGRWLTPRPQCNDLRFHQLIPQETLFWRRRAWDRVGGIAPSFAFALDWDLLLRLSASGARFARLPWFLGAFRLHAGQKTNTAWNQSAIPEIRTLRQRTLGREATHDELHLAMRRAQLDSALVHALFERGWRV